MYTLRVQGAWEGAPFGKRNDSLYYDSPCVCDDNESGVKKSG